jgi:HlyD family secretion protein
MRRLMFVLLAVVVAGGGWYWWQGRAAPPPQPVIAAGPVGVGALGRVEPASRVRKLSHPGGMAVTRIERLLVAEGDAVVAGQTLAEFSDTGQKDAAAAQAEAAVAEARALLAKMQAGGRPSEIAAQRARIAALSAAEEITRRDAVRSETLVPGGAGTVAGAERARFAAMRSAAERAEAEAVLETLSGPRPEDLAAAQARLVAAEANARKARADAALTRVIAPIAGTVLKTYARPGDLVGSDGLMDLADLRQMDVVADVYETDITRLRAGAAAEVIVPGDAMRYAAVVREIGWQVRRTTQAGTDPVAAVDARTVEVRLTLGAEGVAALSRRTNMQVQVAIRP